MKKTKMINGFIGETLVNHMFSTVAAYFLGCLGVVITGIMVGLLVDTRGLAAVSLCLPIYYLFAAVSTLIHSGTSTYAASSAGYNDMEAANRYYTLSFVCSGIFSVVFLAVGLIFTKEIAYFLGARDELCAVTEEYLRILFIGAPASMFMYFPINYMRLTTKPQLSPLGYLIQTSASVALTFVFIKVLDMGAAGGALASVVANYILVILGIILVAKYSDFKLTGIKKCKEEIISMIKVGSAISIDSIGCLVRILVLNTVAYEMGGEGAVCIIGIVSSIAEFATSILLGVPQSTVPLIAIFNSEKDTVSIRETVKTSLKGGFVIIVLFAVLLGVFAPQVASVFGIAEPVLNAQASSALRVFAPGLVFGLLSCMLATVWVTVDRSVIANITVALRSAVIIVPVAFVISSFSDSVTVLSVSFTVSELLTLVIALASALIISKKSNRKSGILLLDDSVEKSGKIAAFTVKNDADSIVKCSESIGDFCSDNDLSPKESMTVSLSIEEMLIVIGEICLNNNPEETVDVRLFCEDGKTGLRIRNGGKKLNILEYAENDPDNMDYMGINMIRKMADTVEYRNTFGANNLLILLK